MYIGSTEYPSEGLSTKQLSTAYTKAVAYIVVHHKYNFIIIQLQK